MRNRFILLIDFSKHSNNLVKYAYEWSLQANAQLLFVHQILIQSPALADDETKQQRMQEAKKNALQKLKDLAYSELPVTDNISYHISENDFQITLPTLLEEDYEDLIFVGLKGTSFLKKLFVGSYSLQVINQTNNIVVAMPMEIDAYSHEKIFVAINEKNPLNLLELNNFLKFIRNENTQITFFHLAAPNEDTTEMEIVLRQLAEIFSDRFICDYAIYEGQDRIENIKNVINNKINEILVVQRGSRFLTDQLFKRFLINELVHEGLTPLIILPD